MNILFLLKYYKMGGVETVSHLLANKFQSEGHKCSVFCFQYSESLIYPLLHQDVELYSGKEDINEDVKLLREILIKNKINIVINQSGHLKSPINILNIAKNGLNIKSVSVYHNMPGCLTNTLSYKHYRNLWEYLNTVCMTFLRRIKARIYMRYVYKKSDYYILLSPSFISKFKKYTWLSNLSKLKVITNPVTIDSSNFSLDTNLKQKEIIYVGRIDYAQKRVYRLINIWALLENDFPDWRLTIVGDGPELSNIKQQAESLGLTRVFFEGIQNPEAYYRRASIIVMTSAYEGFGLVILEGMALGVIPIIYGSYSSVYDIIESGKEGFIIPPCKEDLISKKMADRIRQVITTPSILEKMPYITQLKSSQFSINKIYQSWNNLFIQIESQL